MSMPLMSFEEVRRCLKQRFPMLMIDGVVRAEAGRSLRAIKNVTGNELAFVGHFPGQAVMPGTLIVEAIGQAASVLFSLSSNFGDDEAIVLGSINNMRFLAPVVPGDRIVIDVTVLKIVDDLALIAGVATVDGNTVATGTLGIARRRPNAVRANACAQPASLT